MFDRSWLIQLSINGYIHLDGNALHELSMTFACDEQVNGIRLIIRYAPREEPHTDMLHIFNSMYFYNNIRS